MKILFLLIFPVITFAEGGSVYTRLGLGDMNYAFSARRMSLGELGSAIYDQSSISSFNPASWSRLNLTRFEIGLNYFGYNSKDNNASAYYSRTDFSGFMLGVPVEKSYGIAIVGGIIPYTDVKYHIIQDLPNNENPHKLGYEGIGGLSKAFLGASYNLPFGMSIGASIDYYIGNIDYISRIEFENTSFQNSEYTRTYKLSGIGGTLGIISNDISSIFGTKAISDFRFGLYFSIAPEFDADTTLQVDSYFLARNENTTLTSRSTSTGKTTAKIPYQLGLGFAFKLSNNYQFLFDYFYQPWSEYKFSDLSYSNLRDLQKVSTGLEYKFTEDRSESFWEHIILRGGLSFEQTQYLINEKGINQFSVFAGISFPIDIANSLDFAVEYGTRGTNDFNLVKENILKLNVTLNLAELWFIRK